MKKENPWLKCYLHYTEKMMMDTSKCAYLAMMRAFRQGQVMLGAIGTWRDVWSRERPGEPVPETCPDDWTPRGASYANLQAVAKAGVKVEAV